MRSCDGKFLSMQGNESTPEKLNVQAVDVEWKAGLLFLTSLLRRGCNTRVLCAGSLDWSTP